MRTTINKIPDAIFTSDWHLREDTPICYIGDYQKEQFEKSAFRTIGDLSHVIINLYGIREATN